MNSKISEANSNKLFDFFISTTAGTQEHIFESGGFEGWVWPYLGVVTQVHAGAP